MKNIVRSVIALVATAFIAMSQNLPIFRGPPISEKFSTNLAVWEAVASAQDYPLHLTLQEGELTAPGSEEQHNKSYFAIYVPGTQVILALDPIIGSHSGIYTDMVIFRDVLRGNKEYKMSRLTSVRSVNSDWNPNGLIEGRYDFGSFEVFGQTIWVKVSYDSSPRYPVFQLTWGKGSSPGEVGEIYDDFRFATVEPSVPTSMKMWIGNAVGVTDVPDGMYITTSTQDEKYVLQSTTDFKTWTDEPAPFYILGYTAFHYYSPETVVNNKFFRTKR